jgi:Ca2+-binding EF-hand superfamily protein
MLNNYANASKLKKEALKILLKQLKENDIKKLTKKFEELDEENKGFITVEQLYKVMNSLGFIQTEFEIQELISRIFKNT